VCLYFFFLLGLFWGFGVFTLVFVLWGGDILFGLGFGFAFGKLWFIVFWWGLGLGGGAVGLVLVFFVLRAWCSQVCVIGGFDLWFVLGGVFVCMLSGGGVKVMGDLLGFRLLWGFWGGLLCFLFCVW